ncbi:glycosyltransferase family 4 protein [Patescibacteria group bacterium]|nr:glycosyltransferase family 4 protein [Patescibacteria group bacterium]
MKIVHLTTNLEHVTDDITGTIFAPGVLMYYITEGLVKQGNDVSLFASKEAETSATLFDLGLNALVDIKDTIPQNDLPEVTRDYVLSLAEAAYQEAKENNYDIIHAHEFTMQQFFAPFVDIPVVITCHNPLTEKYLSPLQAEMLKKAKNVYLVSISDSQRKARPDLQYGGTIYHGVDTDRFSFNDSPDDTFAVMGRLVPEKGILEAIEVAKRANIHLVVAGQKKTETKEDSDYFTEIEKNISPGTIDLKGVMPYAEVPAFIGNLKALLFPIKWEEPFGMMMIEAMSCGTPVIAFNRGSVPEIIEHGKTGFVCETADDMVEAVGHIDEIDRQYCREYAEKRFSLARMVADYEALYKEIIEKQK